MIWHRCEFPPQILRRQTRSCGRYRALKQLCGIRGRCPVSYRRGALSRRAQRTPGEVTGCTPQPDRPHPVGISEPFRSPAPSNPPTLARAIRAPRILPLLPNSSAATAFLEARARASGGGADGEVVLDALQFVRVNDVCRLLRISKPTLWRLRRAHAFPEPTELTDRVIAWQRSEVEAWLRERARGGDSGAARASNQPPPPLTDGDDVSRAAKRTAPVATSTSRRRDKSARLQESDEQLVLPLMARE